MARLARFLLSLALFLLVSGAAPAFASESFPPVIQAELALPSPPECTLCHRTNDGGFGTVVTPFGRTMMNQFGLTAVNVNALKAALAASKAQHVDSDGDGVSDIDELEAGMDPNVGASGEVAGLDVPLPETGCSFAAPRSPLGSVSAFVFACLGLVLVQRRRMRSVLRVATLSGPSLAVLTGCSLDTRQLSYAAGGQSGGESQPLQHAGAAGALANAGAAPTNEAGDSGIDEGQAGAPAVPPAPVPLIDGCPDLDGNGVGDCQETLLENGDFKADITGWTSDSDSDIAWDELNATEDTPSGSALISSTNGTASPGASGSVLRVAKQCLELTGKQLVTVYANALVRGDQAADGHAEVDVYFFDVAACAGTYLSNFSTPQPLDASPDQWITLKAGSVSGPNTKSVLVSLALLQPLSAASFAARFDNVMLKKQAL